MKTTLRKKLLTFILPITIVPLIVMMIFYYLFLHKVIETYVVDAQRNILTHIIYDIKEVINDPLKLKYHVNLEHIGLPEVSVFDKEMNMIAKNFDMTNNDEADQKYNRKNLEKYFKKVSQNKNNSFFHDEKNTLLIKPIVNNDQILGYIISNYRKTFHKRISVSNQPFLYLFFIIIFTVSIVSIFVIIFSIKLLHPLELLLDGIKKISSGNLSFNVDNASNDEIGTVVNAFNDMTLKRQLVEKELQDIATHDGLTGLYNHKFFYTKLEDEILRAKRYQHHISLLLLDIDYFKNVNDTYGHRTGDMILRTISERLVSRVRATDWVCRYGGEEITVLLPETDITIAKQIAEDLRILIEHDPFETEDGRYISITVSIGISIYPQHAKDAPTLVSNADMALYEAKESGRNRVCIFEKSSLLKNSI